MKKEKLWLRIPITLAWLCFALWCICVWIPGMSVIYQGNLYFDNPSGYESFKGALANDRYSIEKLEVVDDGGKLVSFKVYVPRETSFPYGTRDDQTAGIIVCDVLIFVACGAFALATGWTWGK